MNLLKKIFITMTMVLTWCLSVSIHAQTIDSDQNPPGIHWKKIESPHFEIVFPRELSGEGNRVANTLEYLYPFHSGTLHTTRKKYTVILTNQGAVANGYVTLAPRKSEWYHMPTQSNAMGSGEWYRLLAVHEGRHMVQFDKMNTGFTRIAGWIMGEYGILGFSFFSVPLWWFEGDAVSIETGFSRTGRGRIPEFGMGLRTLLLNSKDYTYPKMYLGSYHDWTPDWYQLGYHLVAYTRQKYGSRAWDNIIQSTSKWSFWPFSFSNAIKKETGRGLTKLYREALSDLGNKWHDQIQGVRLSTIRTIHPEPKYQTNYWFPHYLDDGRVIAQKYGFDDPFSLVILDTSGHEERIKSIFPLEPGATRGSAAAGKFLWTELMPDVRWGQRQFSSLVMLDVHTGKTHRLIGKCHYFNPDLSPDGKYIAAVEFKTDRQCSLVILDSETGQRLQRCPNPENRFIQSPAWSPDGHRIVYTFQSVSGKGIAIFDLPTGRIHEIMAAQWLGISNPVLHEKYVLFSSPKSGIDNIHAIDVETAAEYQVSSVLYGAFAPRVSPDGKKILFSNYALPGLEVCEMAYDPSAWFPADSAAADATGYADTLTAQENGPLFEDSQFPDMEYAIQDYHPFLNLLNVHSWCPVTEFRKSGLMVYSNDKLNTLMFAAGLMTDTNEDKTGLEIFGTYAGWFPMIDFGWRLTGREARIADTEKGLHTDSWTEKSADLGVRIPFNLSRGIYQTGLQVGIQASMIHVSEKSPYINNKGNLNPLNYQIEFSHLRQGAVGDMEPPWGQMFLAGYRYTPFNGDFRGAQFFSQAILYFPGILKHHSLRLHAAWEMQKPDPYLFPASFPFSHGYDAVFHKRFAYASASYSLPLFYPDFALGNLIYLKRISGRLFYDYGFGKSPGIEKPYRSAGIELFFETHFFNIKFPLNIGVRWVYLIDTRDSLIQPCLMAETPW